MRLLKLSIITATALSLTVAHAADKKESNKANADSSTKSAASAVSEGKIDLVVSGMTWPVGCVTKVRSALTKVPGVVKAEVELPDKAVVTFTKGKVKPDQLIAAVKKAGYVAKERKEKEKKSLK